MSLSPFLRHLLLEIERFCEKPESDGILRNLIAVLNDQFALGEPFQFKTMLPRDRRLKTIFERLSEAPAQNQTLAEWGKKLARRKEPYLAYSPANSVCRLPYGVSSSEWCTPLRCSTAICLSKQ